MQWDKGGLFRRYWWENWTVTCKRMKLEQFLTNTTKKLKMNYRPKCKTRKCKTLRGKHRQKLDDIHHRKILYDPSPRVMEIKTKTNK